MILSLTVKTRFALFLLLLWPAVVAPPAAGELLYPLEQPQAISSNFGQYRHGHPHAGIDLWSFLRLDVPVLAAADGVIFRIKVAPTGYGRVLYQRLNDGRVVVYGHLSAFAPKIETVVRDWQWREGRYRVNATLGRDAIPVKRGEIIGTVGDTATDVPHLHFELRNPQGEPINPLTADFPCRDTRAPVLHALHLEPLSADALVDDEPGGRILDFTRDPQQPDAYRLPAVRLAGKVGLAVEAYDFIDGSSRPLAPYDLRLHIDGEEWFAHRFDRYNYADQTISLLSYHTGLMTTQQRSFIRLYRLHRRTAFHPSAKTGDLSRLSPGEHRAEIVVTDEKGLRAAGRFTLTILPPRSGNAPSVAARRPEERLPESPVEILRDAALTWRPEAVEIGGKGGPAEGAPPAIRAVFQPGNRAVPAEQLYWTTAGDRFRLLLPLPPAAENGSIEIFFTWLEKNGRRSQKLSFAYQTAVNGKTLTAAGGAVRLAFPPDTLYRPVPLTCEISQPSLPPWLAATGPVYSFSPPFEPLRREAALTIDPPSGVPRQGLGIYLYDRGSWYHLETGARAKTPLLGSFALLRDIEPPHIGEFSIDPGGTRVKVQVWDRGSGLSDSGIVLKLDGRQVIAEYLPLKDQLLYRCDPPPAPGRHELVVLLRDRAGNRASASRVFEVK